ncbi:MAG: hypothetical protein Q7S72_00130, partial [Candidatus Taylorbacteria bacterium]|nr:hypothetical protein [Candidatus Taylorbacteria bacterium]
VSGWDSLIVDDDQKKTMETAMKAKDDTVSVGSNFIKTNTIKGIFPLKNDVSIDNGDYIRQINKDFWEDCAKGSKLSLDEKITRELTIRIFPAEFLRRGWIKHSTELENGIKLRVRAYFNKYPYMPRCPAKIWWPLLKGAVMSNEPIAKFHEFISRNDREIYEWAKYNAPKTVY